MARSRKRCYNSGKISGLPFNQAYLKFEMVDKYIEHLGYESVNPIKMGLKSSAPYWAHILFDLWLLIRCDVVFFQSDWVESRGARIENRVATIMGKVLLFDNG